MYVQQLNVIFKSERAGELNQVFIKEGIKIMPLVKPQLLSPAFYDHHHYHVFYTDAKLIGMFASLYCAAQTALHFKAGTYVIDTITSELFTAGRLTRVERDSIIPIMFHLDHVKPLPKQLAKWDVDLNDGELISYARTCCL